MDLPDEKGTYVLIADVAQMKRVEVGQLGQFDIVPGVSVPRIITAAVRAICFTPSVDPPLRGFDNRFRQASRMSAQSDVSCPNRKGERGTAAGSSGINCPCLRATTNRLPNLEQPFNILWWAGQHGSIAPHHNRPLDQIRMLRHESDQFLIRLLLFADAQLLRHWFILAEDVASGQP
jgi:hypothetical protein